MNLGSRSGVTEAYVHGLRSPVGIVVSSDHFHGGQGMNMIKSWRVAILIYRPDKPARRHINFVDVNAPNEQTLRRLVLDAAHERGQFISEFMSIERT